MVELEVWLKAGHTVEIIRRLLPRFEELTGHRVTIEIVPEGRAHDALVRAERRPDVVTAPFWYLDELVACGAVRALPLDVIGLRPADFAGVSIQALSRGDDLLAVPHTLTGGLLSYRADLLDTAGLAVPQTLIETTAVSAALVDAGSAGLGVRANPEFSSLEAYAGWAAARGIIVLPGEGDPELADLENGFADLVEAVRWRGAELTANDYAGLGDMVTRGDVSMIFDTSAWCFQLEDDASPLRGRMGYTVIADAAPAQFLYAEGLAVPGWAPEPEAALEFIRWRHSEEVVRAEVEQVGRIDFPRLDIRRTEWFGAHVERRRLIRTLDAIDAAWDAGDLRHAACRVDFVPAARRLMTLISDVVAGRRGSLADGYRLTYPASGRHA